MLYFLGRDGTLLIVMRMACSSLFEALGGDGEADFGRLFGLGDLLRDRRGELDLIFVKLKIKFSRILAMLCCH